MGYATKISDLITKFNAMTTKLKAGSGGTVDLSSINSSIASINDTLHNPNTGIIKTISELDQFLDNVSAANPDNINLVEVINAVKGRVDIIETEITAIGAVVTEVIGS